MQYDYPDILKPINSTQFTYIERSELCTIPKIKLYRSETSCRLVYHKDKLCREPIGGLLLLTKGVAKGKGKKPLEWTVKCVYVDPNHRRKGIAKGLYLLSIAKLVNVKHSSYLSVEGELWRDSVENLK